MAKIYFTMTSNGANVPLESYEAMAGGVDLTDHAEVINMSWGVSRGAEDRRGMATGHKDYGVVRIERYADKASPVILKSIDDNETAEVVIKTFSNNRNSGSLEHSMTLTTRKGRVSYFSQRTNEEGLVVEDMHVSYDALSLVHETGGTEFEVDRLGG